MRLYVSILAAAGLFSVSACGKKEQSQPEPTKVEQPKKDEPTAEKPKEEPTPEQPKEEPTPEQPAEAPKDPTPVADRTEGVQKALEALSAGDVDAAYANYADDVVLHNVGNPQMPEVKGKATVVEGFKAMKTTTTDLKVKASRIIEAGDIQVVEYVVQGKVAQGEGAEAKAFTIPAAMVLEYNADGKVATVWNFQDDASLLQQIGAVPGLPEGFVAVAFPETTEVVKGEKNDALAALYKDFGSKIMSAETIDAAVELLAEDYTAVDFMSGKTLGKADTGAELKKFLGMFADKTNTIDKEFSVGEFYVTVSTMNGTYKGGIEGVEGKDQKVTITSLDVSRIVDGKFKSWANYSNGMQMLAGLGLLGGAAEKPAEEPKAEDGAQAGGEIGVAECDAYLKAVRECMTKLPEAALGQFEIGIKSALDSWKQLAAGGDAARSALAQACKQAVDASKQAMGTMCPDVKWD